MPDNEKIKEFIRAARAEGISEERIDAEVTKMLGAAPDATSTGKLAPPPPTLSEKMATGWMGMLGGKGMADEFEQFRQRQMSDPEYVNMIANARKLQGNLGTAAAGGLGTIPMIGMNLIQRGLQGQEARRLNMPEEAPTPMGTAAESAFMAVAPPATKAVIRGGLKTAKVIAKHGGRIGRNLLARLAGVKNVDLETAISNKIITDKNRAPRAMDVVSEMRETLETVREVGIPEYAEASKILKRARPVKVSQVIKLLRDAIGKPIGPEQRAAAQEIQRTIDDIAKAYGKGVKLNESAGGGEVFYLPDRLSPGAAETLKRTLQGMAKYEGRVASDPFNNAVKRAAASLRQSIEKSMPSSADRAAYRSLMDKVANKMDVKNKLAKKVGEYKESAENFVRSLHRSGRTEQRVLVEKFDKLFGTKFMEKSKLADTIEAFGGETPTYTTPRFTATGGLFGPRILSMVTGGMLGSQMGGPVGAGVGTLGGLVIGSPRGAIAAGRGVNSVEGMLRGIAREGGQRFNEIIPFIPAIIGSLNPTARDIIRAIMSDETKTDEQKTEEIRQELAND